MLWPGFDSHHRLLSGKPSELLKLASSDVFQDTTRLRGSCSDFGIGDVAARRHDHRCCIPVLALLRGHSFRSAFDFVESGNTCRDRFRLDSTNRDPLRTPGVLQRESIFLRPFQFPAVPVCGSGCNLFESD